MKYIRKLKKKEKRTEKEEDKEPKFLKQYTTNLTEKAASGGDLNSRLAYLREKKAKLHKGKVDQK